MGISRVRSVALVVTAILGVSTAAVTSAEATVRRAAPTASVRQVDATTVVVSGRTATSHPRVRFQKRTASGWVFVKRVRAHAHRYTATLSVPAGTTRTFRATSNHRSRKFTVTMAERFASSTKKPAPTQYDACGARPRKADGSLWSCTFDDEFAGTALDRTKWVPNTYFATWSGTTHACYRDDPSNVNVADGVLSLTMLKLDAPASCALAVEPTQYMSGSVSTYHLFSQQYGRFEARMKTTAASTTGLHEAFWLWPDDRYSTINWPDSGEIDVAETFSAHPTTAGSYLHYDSDQSSLLLTSNAMNCAASRGVWNTFAVEWGPSRIETFVNGKSCLVNTSADPAFQKRYIINLTQGMGGGTWNQLVDGTPIPATVQFDYVHVWQ
ncbi:MAG TPA: glycoside hydrolase family 16 protein [Marmoricola sp.]|jgi:beta-glucanase (GH16 family)|nr:glycoside hydrolase family 16 protein [Marmoricola sp.]